MGGGKVFLVNRENMAFIRGERDSPVLKSQYHSGIIIINAILVLFLLVTLAAAAWSWRSHLAFERAGVITTGELLDVWRDEDSDGAVSYHARYQFTHEGTPYTRQRSVSRSFYSANDAGGPVAVIYLPGNPAASHIASQNEPPMLLIGVAGVVLVLAAGVMWASAGYADTNARLKRDGKVIRGEILKARETTDSDGDRMMEIFYTFPSRQYENTLIEGKYELFNEGPHRPLPPDHTPVAVFVLDDRTYRLL